MLQTKKDRQLKSTLGLSQEEAAMLLGITRLQWAQFTTGRRDIPVAAKLKLAEVLSAIEKNKNKSKAVHKLLETEYQQTKDWLQQEWKAIKFKEVALERKIKKIQQVREDAFKALEIVQYLVSKNDTNMAKLIEIRIKNTLKKNSLQQLQELELKKENLEMLKLQLSKKLKL